jgi:DNA-binding transcriptional LysR family regulator
MPLSHRHIEVFRAVMTAGSVTGAAELLFTSQPTVSRELARMESLLAYALFERGPGRVRPTARALALFEEVQRVYQGLDQVVARAQALGRAEEERLQVLTLPALAHALLPAASARWLARHPQATLTLTPQESPLLEEWMGAQRFDIGLSEGSVPVPGTHGETLAELDEVCVLPAGHPLAAKPVLEPGDFEGERFVSLAAEDPYRRQFDTLFAAAGVQRRLQVETHSAMAVCALVQQGVGIALVNPLTAWACAHPHPAAPTDGPHSSPSAALTGSGGLVVRPFSVSVPFRIQALRPQHRPTQALADDFIAAVKDVLQAVRTKHNGQR